MKTTRYSSHRFEIADLARLLPVPAERDLPAGRRQILKEHLMTQLHQSARPPKRRRHARTIVTAVAGASAVAVTAAGLTLGLLSGNGAVRHHLPGQEVAPAQVPATAVKLLDKIAYVASRQPSSVVRDSQYVYVRSAVAYAAWSGADGTLPKPRERQIWTSVSDLCKPGMLRERGISAEPGNPVSGDTQILNSGLCGGGHVPPNRGTLSDPTYRLLQTLPTDPHALLKMIYAETPAHGWAAHQMAFKVIGDMLLESIVPPRVSAAAYRAAALIPGVRLVRDAHDAIGRDGVGVALLNRYGPATSEWIFDRASLRLLGERGTLRGKTMDATAILQRAFVDRLGQLPPN